MIITLCTSTCYIKFVPDGSCCLILEPQLHPWWMSSEMLDLPTRVPALLLLKLLMLTIVILQQVDAVFCKYQLGQVVWKCWSNFYNIPIVHLFYQLR